MSNSFLAGQRLTAANMPGQRLWTVSATSTSSPISAETVVFTAPSSTYRAHSAYRIWFNGLLRFSTTAGRYTPRIRDTNASGTTRMDPGDFDLASAVSLNIRAQFFHVVANTGANDITSRILVMTGQASAGTCAINAGATAVAVFACEYVGVDSDFPEAVAL